ncbi:hypothetical protein GN244_ATG15048 [Phytophthora infestans]|uniref:Uncharacterized protein n=1 Tax=Phytophthora infestans TaxID=4787 RepID=A0A833W8Q9_PHYIN|nr:hypothetical protein GN244_ATG15048 [Phytophthora infestans]
MVGPTCKQCEAKIDPLLQNPQRSTTDARARCVCCGSCSTAYAFRTISGRDIVRRCIACENGPKAVELLGGKARHLVRPKCAARKAWRNVKKAMGPDWYPKKKEAQPPSQADRPKCQNVASSDVDEASSYISEPVNANRKGSTPLGQAVAMQISQ